MHPPQKANVALDPTHTKNVPNNSIYFARVCAIDARRQQSDINSYLNSTTETQREQQKNARRMRAILATHFPSAWFGWKTRTNEVRVFTRFERDIPQRPKRPDMRTSHCCMSKDLYGRVRQHGTFEQKSAC